MLPLTTLSCSATSFRQITSTLELCDQIGKLKELMSGLGQMIVLVSMLIDSTTVIKSTSTVSAIGLFDELVWFLWSSSSATMFLDSWSVLTMTSDTVTTVHFKDEFNYMLSCYVLCYKVSLINKCFYTSMITNEIGCLTCMIERLLSTVQLYYFMNYLNDLYGMLSSGFNVTTSNLLLLSSITTINVNMLFTATSLFRLSDEYYVLRFYLKGWLNWSEFMCWVSSDVNYFYLSRLFCYGLRIVVELVFYMLHYLVDYLKKVMVSVFNLGLGAVCNIWVSSFIFKGFAYELSTLDLWVLLFLVISVKSLSSFSYLWSWS